MPPLSQYIPKFLALAALLAASASLHAQPANALASPRWISFVSKVAAYHNPPVSRESLDRACAELPSSNQPQTPDEQVDACIQAEVARLGDVSYTSPVAWQKQQASTQSNAFSGIGLELRAAPMGEVEIVSPITGAPGERAGLLAGDRMFSIDGVDTLGMASLTAVLEALRGPPGSLITVRVHRPGVAEPLAFTMRREPIRPPTVRQRGCPATLPGYR